MKKKGGMIRNVEKKKDLSQIIWKGKIGDVEKEVCAQKRREDKELIERKNMEHNERRLKEVVEDKTMSKFWKEIVMKK